MGTNRKFLDVANKKHPLNFKNKNLITILYQCTLILLKELESKTVLNSVTST